MREPGPAGPDWPPWSDAAGDRAFVPSAHRRLTPMRIALDAMGGDHAPGPIVAGAVQAAAADPELRVVLVGDQAQVEPLLAGAEAVRDRLEVFHCTQVVGMDESPVVGLRKKPDN